MQTTNQSSYYKKEHIKHSASENKLYLEKKTSYTELIHYDPCVIKVAGLFLKISCLSIFSLKAGAV